MSSDELAIQQIQSDWLDATARGDLNGVLALMTEDVVFLVPGRVPFGRQEFIDSFQANLSKFIMESQGTIKELTVLDEVAYSRSYLQITLVPIPEGETIHLAGYTLSIYRKQLGGNWLLARDANFVTRVAK